MNRAGVQEDGGIKTGARWRGQVRLKYCNGGAWTGQRRAIRYRSLRGRS